MLLPRRRDNDQSITEKTSAGRRWYSCIISGTKDDGSRFPQICLWRNELSQQNSNEAADRQPTVSRRQILQESFRPFTGSRKMVKDSGCVIPAGKSSSRDSTKKTNSRSFVVRGPRSRAIEHRVICEVHPVRYHWGQIGRCGGIYNKRHIFQHKPTGPARGARADANLSVYQ